MEPPRIQYCRTSDGVDLAYFVIGSGPPLIWVSGVFRFEDRGEREMKGVGESVRLWSVMESE